MIEFRDPVAEHIKAFILDETAMEIDNRDYPSDPVWREYRETGSKIWLYGNAAPADTVWTRDMEAIYLDTPLLTDALRKDHFTDLITEANKVLKGLPRDERVNEIAFIISARNAVRTSKRFAAKVCVEIPLFSVAHTEIGQYARRLYQICPEHIMPSLPYSPAGLKAAAELEQAGIPVVIHTGVSLLQVQDSIQQSAPSYVAVGLFHDTGAGPSVKDLNSFLDLSSQMGVTPLIACGLDSPKEIHQFKGFPVIIVTPSAAEAYHKDRQASSPESSNAAQTTSQNRLWERDIAVHSREGYRKLVLLIRNTIDSN
ncbi:hypothetical protein [Marispirochaeta sp.]|jgi:hypothetical protein|uniref:hypothetical protein n=1 Tax=Marispirochaeta sp. TaxID=2038653 RepID=UPI0029C619FB|nr:hypothetical protein [Marispirochaeta sp.]